MLVRRAAPADAEAIAQVHVTSWRETYAGLVPDVVLANLSVADRTAMWRSATSRPEAPGANAVFVAEQGGAVVGFASCCNQRTSELRERGFTAEISAIYVLRAAQRRGVGAALMAAVVPMLVERGQLAATLWVLRENASARRFYERLGGEVVGEKEDRRPDVSLFEIAYGWRDLGQLLAFTR